MYNTFILRLIEILSGTVATTTGYPAGLFAGSYFAQSSFADAYGSLGTIAVGQLYELTILGVG